jgi:hypothetical protein
MVIGLRAAGVAVIAIVMVLVIAGPKYGNLGATPLVFDGALLAALIAIVAAVSAPVTKAAGHPDLDFSAAAMPAAIGAVAFAILGIVTTVLVPGEGGKPNETWLAIGLIVVGLIAVVLVFSDGSMPTFTWSKLPVITTIAAGLLVAAFAATILFMLQAAGQTGTSETVWARYLVIFTAVQGVGLAAVGALLGTQVKEAELKDVKKTGLAVADAAETLEKARGPIPAKGAKAPSDDEVAAARATVKAGRLRMLR